MITGWFLSKKKGSGASVFIQELKTGLEGKGVRVDLITPQFLGVQNYYLATLGRILKNLLLNFKDFNKYDLIVGFDYDGFNISRKNKVPFVSMPRCVFRDVANTEKGFSKLFVWFQSILEQVNLSHSDFIISNSVYAKKMIQKYYGMQEEKIAVVYTGININSRLSADTEIVRKDDGIIRFLSVGKMYPRKNIPLLLKVFDLVHQAVPNTELHLVGDGLEYQKVLQIKEKLSSKNQIKTYGFVSDPKFLKEIYTKSDVVCHFAEQEAFGNVVLEALALGKPVFALDKASLPEQVQDGYNGLLFTDMDINNISRKIIKNISQPGHIKSMSQHALISSERFTKQKMIENFYGKFSEIAKKYN